MGRQKEIEEYIRSQAFFREALSKLKDGREIAMKLNFDGAAEGEFLVMCLKSGELDVAFRQPQNADVCFHANERAIEKILSTQFDSIAAFGIQVVKLVAAKDMKIQVLTGPLKLIMGGYIEIVRLGGSEFFTRLKDHGLKGPTDIIRVFKKFKKS